MFFFSWAPLNFFNIVDLFVQASEDPGTQVSSFDIFWNDDAGLLIDEVAEALLLYWLT